MVELADENRGLKAQLAAVEAEAARKDIISRAARKAAVDVLTADSLIALIERLFDIHLAGHQLGLTVVLSDPSHEIRHMISQKNSIDLPGLKLTERIIVYVPPYATLRHFHAAAFDEEHHRSLFPGVQDIGAVALLPLFRDQRLTGVINIASEDPDEFADPTMQDAMVHLATVLSLCLENALNRERLIRAGLTDTLTGLSNRRYFDRRMSEELYSARRYQRPLACLMIDLDHFKGINDRYGHSTGDHALKHVAARVRSVARGSDVVARFGGEEFCVLAPATGETSAATLAERIRDAIAATPVRLENGGGEIDVSVSIGVATIMPTGGLDDIDAISRRLVDDADQAMYAAKQAGRNCVRSAVEAPAVVR